MIRLGRHERAGVTRTTSFRLPFSLLSDLDLFSRLEREDFSMVDHRPVQARYTWRGNEGEWKGGLQGISAGPHPGLYAFLRIYW